MPTLRKACTAAIAASVFLTTPAVATTVDFAYLNGSTSVATGSFSYADGASGVLNYGDLTTFAVSTNGVTYRLADVQALTQYVYFGYDTAANTFVTSPLLTGSAGSFTGSLSALNANLTSGFFFAPLPTGEFTEFSLPVSKFFTSVSFVVAAPLPEPATWMVMMLGLATIGGVMRHRPGRTAMTAR
jgi:hypothetical protein